MSVSISGEAARAVSQDTALQRERAQARRSVPPLVTEYPNPYLLDFASAARSPNCARPLQGPFVGDLVADDRHPVYSFHPYHTKVPPSVIRRLIEHYTQPGDIVLDIFAGSGMTGVAAQEAGRDALLIDLSPAATFIAGVNTRRNHWQSAVALLHEAIDESYARHGALYLTDDGVPANYFVWSDVFRCPECSVEFPFFPFGVNHTGTKVETLASFPCPSCDADLNVRRVSRVIHDGRKQKELVWVNAGSGRARINRPPTKGEQDRARLVEITAPTDWYPTDPVDIEGYSARLAQLGDKGITDVSRFLSGRNLTVFADLWCRLENVDDAATRNVCLATLTSIFTVISERQGYFGGGGGMSGNLYMPIVRMEKNVYDTLRRKLGKLVAAEKAKSRWESTVVVSTQSATDLSAIPSETIDYIYTDPPFGANIIYSEVNLVLESWLGVHTDSTPEAVIDERRGKDVTAYADLLRASFSECARVLKGNRWITVEFHNTAPEVWQAIQSAIVDAGLDIISVSVLDKGTTTILGDIRPHSAKHDLLIHAVKRAEALPSETGSSVRLADLDATIRDIARSLGPVRRSERRHYLFSRLVAHLLQRQLPVSFSSRELNARLDEFPDLDPGVATTEEESSTYSGETLF